MSDGAGAEAWSYDAMGRVVAARRTTNGITKTFSYSYNLDGSLASLTYPSGRRVDYGYDAAGRVQSAVDQASGINYALGASYAPHGALASVVLGPSGSFGGVELNQAFNNRLQPVTIRAWSPNGVVLDLEYCFNAAVADFAQACSAAPVVNNGNVARIVNHRDPGRSQRFTYDELNRIATARTQATTGPHCWGEVFAYDIWANLLSIGGLSPDYNGCTQENLSVTVTAKNQISGNTYDAAGNMIFAPGMGSYAYDAENRMTAAAGVTYSYDGDGKRLGKDTDSDGILDKIYWYGMSADALVETDSTGANPTEYIFFGGKRIARRDPNGSVFYFFADHLGSSRVVTNAAGVVVQESDYYPFGGERVVVNTVDNRYKFTGKERDTESGLDYFTARYLGSSLGRFVSADPVGGHQEEPQTLNRYAYVRNNPPRFTDPTGLDFYLQCTETEENKSTCQGGRVGTTDENGKFTPTVVTSASLQDPKSGNTATVNENGVLITTGGQTYQGIFINGTPAADIQGSGAFTGFSFNINGNCGGTCLASGSFLFNGSADEARRTLDARGAWRYWIVDSTVDQILFHPNSTQHRFGDGPSPHFSVPNTLIPKVVGYRLVDSGRSMRRIPVVRDVPNPQATIPVRGDFHVDTHTFPRHLWDAVKSLFQ